MVRVAALAQAPPVHAISCGGGASSHSSFGQQLKLLLGKNIACYRRNKFASSFPLLIPPLLILVLFVIGADDTHNRNGFNAATLESRHPVTERVTGIALCDTTLMRGCRSPLAIVGSLNSVSSSVVSAMLAASPQVDANTVEYFNSSLELNRAVLDEPHRVLAAVHFASNFSLAHPKYILQYNRTRACLLGAFSCNDPLRDVGMPLQLVTERAILEVGARIARADPALSLTLDVGISEFAHPEMRAYQRDLTKLYSELVIYVILSFTFFIQLNQLATEKDLKLKLQMRVMGTRDGPMWLAWLLTFWLVSIVSTLVLNTSIHAFHFDFLTDSAVSVYFTLFLVGYLAHTSLACFISAICNKANTARAAAAAFVMPIIFAYSYINNILFTDLVPAAMAGVLAMLPPVVFMKALVDLVQLGPLQWSDRHDNAYRCPATCEATFPGCKCRYTAGQEPEFIWPLDDCISALAWQILVYLLLALYFEQTTTAPGFGNAQPAYFFLQTSYWTGRPPRRSASERVADVATDETDDGLTPVADVIAEQERVLAAVDKLSSTTTTGGGGGEAEDGILIVNLKKVFKKGGKAFTAVSRINLGIANDTIFCLLGHNGAGKTTTFNMLAGILRPTRGDAFILGKSIRRQLRAVQSTIGLCPQHDVLWDELTADEHLKLFGGLSGVQRDQLDQRVSTFLKSVDLLPWRHVACGKYSGGMKRRLSVANALIADPKVVYLDEPTTGMDPVNRRGVWDVIERAKHGRIVVLTTHAMEEAETLGDRIGIMSRGRLLCLGPTLHLKSAYGTGYTVDVTCDDASTPKVLEIVSRHSSQATQTGKAPCRIVAKVPQVQSSEVLPKLYRELAAAREAEGMQIDTALNMCTLEEVFIKLAEEAQDPEWLQLRYGEAEPLKWYEKCRPKLVREHKAKVAEIEMRKKEGAAAGADPLLGAGSAAALPEDQEMLSATLSFKPAKYGTQHKALTTKIDQFAKKQKKQQQLCQACTFYGLLIIFAAESIVSIIVGTPQYSCEISETDQAQGYYHPFAKGNIYSLNAPLTNPNLDATDRLVSDLQYLRNARNYTTECVAKELSTHNPSGLSEQERYDHYNLYAWKAVCAWESKDKLPDHILLSEVEDTLRLFACDMTAWAEMHAAYAYLRNGPSLDEVCKISGRPNITYSYDGGATSFRTENLQCDAAMWRFKSTCSNVTAPPRLCPRDISLEQEREEQRTDIGVLLGRTQKPRLGHVLSLAQEYNCAADADTRMIGYGTRLSMPPAEETPAYVIQCVSERMCAVSDQCAASANRLYTFGTVGNPALVSLGGFPQCNGSALAMPSLAQQSLNQQAWASNDEQRDADNECLDEAFEYCKLAEAFRQCPGLVRNTMPKLLPYSADPSMSATELASLGSLRYDPVGIQPQSCAPNCLEHMLNLQPVEQSGVLGGFALDRADQTLATGLSYLQVDCIQTPTSSAPCAVTRKEMDELLYKQWPLANRSDVYYIDRLSALWFVAAFQEGSYQAALHFDRWDVASTSFDYTVLYNGTFWPNQLVNELGFGNLFVDVEVPAVMHRVHSALYKHLSGQPHAELEGETMVFPQVEGVYAGLSITRILAPFMFTFISGVLYPIICWAVVSEKSAKLREIMVMSGLTRAPYWIITWTHYFILYLFQSLIVFLFCFLMPKMGAAAKVESGLGFKLFANHDPFVLVLLWISFGAAIISFSCFTTTLFNDKYVAIIVPFFVIEICGITAYVLTDNAVQIGANADAGLTLAGLVPFYAFTNAVQVIAAATGDPNSKNGVRLSTASIGRGIYSPIRNSILLLFFDCFLYTLLFVYCDMVLPVGPGVKRHPLFFLKRSFWKPGASALDIASCLKPAEPAEPEDVSAERARVATGDDLSDQVRCLGLRKVYPGASEPAVKNVQFGIKHSECFGLLGSNGAGKSTTIHMLCGLLAPSEGTVVVRAPDGDPIDTRTNLTSVQAAMGVCPQDNLLWGDLTGDEHLQFFGRLRGLKEKSKENGKSLKKQIEYWLRRVNLATRSTRKKPSHAYSGGMKRRLSVACSFIGNPRLVYLDEPSTGLDPESRRQLWYSIRAAQCDKSIILTTHALEEADALCNRIGIMTHGQLRVLGGPAELRIRFDQGYTLSINASPSKVAQTMDLVKNVTGARAALRDEINGVLVYQVNKQDVAIDKLFEAIDESKAALEIKDWGLSQTSLEEVFLAIVAASPKQPALGAEGKRHIEA